ncbi:MAG TPA: response regulator [Pyrinomonadaceae bacterium]|nr:response regulator [Pyrinomonadaceae bacterium]
MLAGRKLLLADDSATIQKVIDLTFADEGVRVLAVSNGQEALDKIEEFAPDIVLADVFMPSPDGYEVCRYVKTNEKLKHIPVMLLVGSFEPFDEAEARRVGADDILTKPFSSIRRLIDRVGALVGSPPAEKSPVTERPTAELPKTEELTEEPLLSTQELEVTTADTMPLPGNYPDEIIATLPKAELSAGVSPSARLEALLNQPQSSQKSAIDGTSEHEGRMEPAITETKSDSHSESADVLLDLGDLEPAHASADDFVLDLDDAAGDELAAPAPMRAYETPARAFVEPQVTEAPAPAYESSYQPAVQASEAHSSFAETQEVPYASDARYATEARDVRDIEPYEPVAVPPELTPDPVPVFGETEFPVTESSEPATASQPAPSFSADQLSPEMIDAIARRCVELMSDKVIREIAWEVVPDLAELLIKRQLEEKQTK